MFKNDHFLGGALLGFIFPVLAYVCVEILKLEVQFLGKKHLLYIASVVINLILLRLLYKTGKAETASGIIFSTFISALLFVILNRN